MKFRNAEGKLIVTCRWNLADLDQPKETCGRPTKKPGDRCCETHEPLRCIWPMSLPTTPAERDQR